MLLRSTTFGGKSLAIAASAVAHVALVLATRGAAHAPSSATARVTAAELRVEAMIDAPPLEDTPLANRATEAVPHPHHHTHPYPVPADHDLVPHDPSLVHAHDAAPVPALATAPLAAPDPLPHFAMTIAPSANRDVAIAAAPGTDALDAHAAVDAAEDDHDHNHDAPYDADAVDVPARRLAGPAPSYPVAARRDGIEADVALVLVVARDGSVERADVVTRAGHGFDEAAIEAAERLRFTPAQKRGHAVRVRVAWTTRFKLD